MSEKRQKDAAEMPETKKEDPIENNDEDDDYDEDEDDGNYDDDHNNNYICESDDDDYETNEHDLYENDPEYFDYECFPLQKIDWIVDKKCERIVQALKLDDKLDAVYLLKQYKWNCGRIVDLYNKDKSTFMSSHFSDDNNNNSKNTASYDKRRLVSYLNIFNDAGPTTHKTYRTLGPVKQHTQANYCNICCNQIANADVEMLALDECGHFFCAECWRMHFESLITSSGSSVFECMQTKCKAMVSKDFVVRCLGGGKSKTLLDKYRQMVTIDLIKESDDLQMCPGEEVIQSRPSSSSSSSSNSRTNSGADSTPNSSFSFSSALMNTPKTSVTHVNSLKLVSTVTSTPTISFSFAAASPVVVSGASSNAAATATTTVITKKCHHIVWIKSKPASRRVVCTQCKTQYCFLCTLPYHAPNDCQTIRKWNVKCQDDSETRNYLLVHTQDCPKCKVCIEKNGGCSHMTCNRCRHEFCWVCANDWKTHGATYDCNRYKGNPEQDNAREALNRYTHYYHRWINHSNSLKFEKALREQCQLKIQEKIMNRGGGTLVDWEFLTEAVEVLTRARFTLQYTYPYAYYLNDNESKLLFENIQAELEREVENLSHSLEKVNLNDKYNIKIQMNIVEKRRKTLLKDFIK